MLRGLHNSGGHLVGRNGFQPAALFYHRAYQSIDAIKILSTSYKNFWYLKLQNDKPVAYIRHNVRNA